MAEEIPYSKTIHNKVQDGARAGLSMRAIFAQIIEGDYLNTPKSTRTFYKKYQSAYDAALADQVALVGSKVFNQAINGDDNAPNTFKARELVLRSKGGWSPKETVEIGEAEDEEDNLSAVESILNTLGLNKK